MEAQRYAKLGALTFVAMLGFAIIHRALGGDYHGFVRGHDVAIDLGLGALWLVGAAMLMIRRSELGLFVTMVAVAVTAVHGVMFSISSRHGLGMPFMLAALWLAYAVKHSLPAWQLTRWTRTRPSGTTSRRAGPAHRAV